MPLDTIYLIILVVGMLLAFCAAVGAVLAGLWFAGRLTGMMGKTSQVVSTNDLTADSGLVDGGNEPDPLESVPWVDTNGQPEVEDPGADPEAWEQAPN